MKRKILKKLTASICAFLILTVVYFLAFTLPVYTYESSDRGMVEMEVPWKGRSLDLVEAQFAEYKYWKNNSDLILYRTSKRIWYAPNLWWDNFTNRRWSIPYMEASLQPRNDYSVQMKKDIQEEYNIYQTVIEGRYLNEAGYIDWVNNPKFDPMDKNSKEFLPKTLIVVNETISSDTRSMQVDLDFLIRDNSAHKKLIESWRNINKETTILKDYFSFSTEHILISQEQKEEAFLPLKWKSFYKRYPKALGCFTLSRVGFDDNKTSALVYVVNFQGSTWGSCIFYFLSKLDGQKWEIIKEDMTCQS
jgi:hypothetical protein